MECIKLTVKSSLLYIRTLLKWTILATLVGLAGGIIGSIFHESVEIATSLREKNGWLIYLLPLGGVVIAFIYALSKKKGRIDTNRVIESARDEESVPLVMAPLIFVSTVITHLLGGSAGREGAALQLGGSIGYNMGRLTRLNKNDMHIIVMSGMSSVFSALFGTPLTAAFFAIEVVSVGIIHYGALVPCILS
ncbi:MAG: chloride channel protein, partial [Clostridia bacterium]|nr:chloride channel protein [Clostridia bacterium]